MIDLKFRTWLIRKFISRLFFKETHVIIEHEKFAKENGFAAPNSTSFSFDAEKEDIIIETGKCKVGKTINISTKLKENL